MLTSSISFPFIGIVVSQDLLLKQHFANLLMCTFDS